MEKFVCVQCGMEFTVSGASRDRIDHQGFDPPKRCPECRKHRSRLEDDERRAEPRRRRDKKKHYYRKYDLE